MRRPSRRGLVEPFHVMEVVKAAAERAASGQDVIWWCVGQPSTPAPRAVRDAAVAAIESQVLGYTEALGVLELRQAIAAHYLLEHGLSVDPGQVAVTTGSSGGFTALFLAAFEAGDTVAMARPGYPAYRNTLRALGCEVVELDCGPATRYQPTVAMLEALRRPPAGVIVASPANPTGTIMVAAELAAIATWCAEHDCLLVSDEIYHGISYGRRCATAWESSGQAAVVGSFSKYFSMTGWRLGWLLLPPQLVRPVELLLGNLNLCAPALSQAAATAAFTPSARQELAGHVARYAANRDVLARRLPQLGLGRVAPVDGAFYVYADVSDVTDDSLAWCETVLADTGVAMAPGVDFAPARPGRDSPMDGRRFVRISFSGSGADLAEGLDRLTAYLR